MTQSPAPRPAGMHTLVILFAIVTVAAALTPLLPTGLFAKGVPVSLESFRYAPRGEGLQLFGAGEQVGYLNFLFHGLTSGSATSAAIGVIALLFIVGGAFSVITATGAVDRGLQRLIASTGHRPALLLGSLTLAFSLGGAVFGMGEETIAFVALLVPLTDRLGLPRECAVMSTYMASQIGFGTSWMNPFSVAIAQSIAGVPVLSGAPFRIGVWTLCTLAAAVFTILYARRHRAEAMTGDAVEAEAVPMNWADKAILSAIALTIAWIVWGVVARQYYLPEIAAQFFTLGLVCGLVGWADRRLDPNRIAEAFVEGARLLVPVALVIAAAKGLLWILGGTDPHAPSVLNSLLFWLASAMEHWPPLLAAQGMYVLQGVFNFFVTSGSAQAAITMPLMAGLGDLVGVTRQVAVLAFQLGDGFTNLVVPTSAVLIGVLGVAGVGWVRWVAVIWRFVLLLVLLGAGAIALAVLSGFH